METRKHDKYSVYKTSNKKQKSKKAGLNPVTGWLVREYDPHRRLSSRKLGRPLILSPRFSQLCKRYIPFGTYKASHLVSLQAPSETRFRQLGPEKEGSHIIGAR